MDFSQYKQPLIIPISEREYVLIEEYSHVMDYEGRYYKIVVPVGFIYDGASVPRLAWTFSGILPDGLNRAGALVHDFLYENKGVLPENSLFVLQQEEWAEEEWVPIKDFHYTRKMADKTFYRLLRDSGVSKFKRKIAYLAVRAGGFIAWRT